MIFRAIRFGMRTIRAATDPVGYAREIGVQIGKDCYFYGVSQNTFGVHPYLIKIGNNCAIAHGVDFMTHDGAVHQFRGVHPDIDVFEPIIIGDNVFVGAHSVLLPGTTIGDNCIIGAGCVLRGKFAPHTLIAGNPARPVGTAEGYWERLKSKTVPTFHLKPEEKRAYLLKHFAAVLNAPADKAPLFQSMGPGKDAAPATRVHSGAMNDA